MASLIVGGVSIPVAPGGIQRDRNDLSDRARSFDGTYRVAVAGSPKRDWMFSTPPIPRQNADFYESILTTVAAQACSGDVLGGSQNLLLRSEEIDHAAWGKTGVTVTPNVGIGPPGGTTVDLVAEDASVGQHYISQSVAGLTDNAIHTVSSHIFPAERNVAYLAIVGKDGVARYAYFNVVAGTVGTVVGGPSTSIAAAPAIESGWFRCSVSATVGSGGGTPQVLFGLAPADNVSSYAGVPGSRLYFWGNQFEQGSMTSYLQTTTVARSTLTTSCHSEVTGWAPVRVSSGHAVVLDFTLHEA